MNDFDFSNLGLIYRLHYLSSIIKNKFGSHYLQVAGDHPFLADLLKLLEARHVSEQDFVDTINKRLDILIDNFTEDAAVITALAKYPPAMGLIGATSGMISMMMTIGSGDKSSIGKSMAAALIATLWGIAFSNFILLPWADLTIRMNNANIKNRKMIVEALDLIKKDKEPALVLELLLSYVPYDAREKVAAECATWYRKHIDRQNA